jgi:hypothetical protein
MATPYRLDYLDYEPVPATLRSDDPAPSTADTLRYAPPSAIVVRAPSVPPKSAAIAVHGKTIHPDRIHTLVFAQRMFTKETAIAWAAMNGFRIRRVQTTEAKNIRIRTQEDRTFSAQCNFETIEIAPGVMASVRTR